MCYVHFQIFFLLKQCCVYCTDLTMGFPILRVGLKQMQLMQLHWALRHGVRAGCVIYAR